GGVGCDLTPVVTLDVADDRMPDPAPVDMRETDVREVEATTDHLDLIDGQFAQRGGSEATAGCGLLLHGVNSSKVGWVGSHLSLISEQQTRENRKAFRRNNRHDVLR